MRCFEAPSLPWHVRCDAQQRQCRKIKMEGLEMFKIKKNAIAAALAAIMLAAAIPAGAETVSANKSTGSAQIATGQTIPTVDLAAGSSFGVNKAVAVNT